MAIDGGTVYEQNDQRDVRRLEIKQQHFFLKRVTSEKISSALESYLGGKLAHSKPFKEMLHFKFLRAKGFAVAGTLMLRRTSTTGWDIPDKCFRTFRDDN